MTIPFAIPKELHEFVSIFDWMSNVPDGDLNEDLELAPIQRFLQSRYGDLEGDKFESRWKSDRNAFNKLCREHGAKHRWLGYFEAYLLSAPHILADVRSSDSDENHTLPPLILHVELPQNFTTENEYGSVRAHSENVECEIVPTALSVLDFKLKNLHHQDDRRTDGQRPQYRFIAVDWGAVSGWKVVTGALRDSKYISYLLRVPGGACFAEVHCHGENPDESLLEHSLSKVTVEATE